MKLQLCRRDKGLSLLGALVIFSCIIALGYILLKILMRCADMIPPPVYLQPGADTNLVTSVSRELYESLPATLVMPSFTFNEDELSIMTVTEESTILIERSTNLVDWQPAWRLRLTDEFNFGMDTNNSPWCFYRMQLE